MEVQVAHYTPSIFPLVPILNPGINRICSESWKIIVAKKEMTESGFELNGITLFYNDFYARLDEVDEKLVSCSHDMHSAEAFQLARLLSRWTTALMERPPTPTTPRPQQSAAIKCSSS